MVSKNHGTLWVNNYRQTAAKNGDANHVFLILTRSSIWNSCPPHISGLRCCCEPEAKTRMSKRGIGSLR